MRKSVKKLTYMAILTAAAVIIFIIEAQIPLPIPIPGVKLGLANAITLFSLFYTRQGDARTENRTSDLTNRPPDTPEKPKAPGLTTADAFGILLCRIVLGAVFTGRLVAFAYSLTGGLLGFAAQAIAKKFVSHGQIWVCGAIGAVFHNIGQILAAMLITGTPSIAAYLPILIIAGILTGATTGLAAQITLIRIGRM